MRFPQTVSPAPSFSAPASRTRHLVPSLALEASPPAQASHREEAYTVDILQRALRHYGHLGAMPGGSGFLASRSNLGRTQEALWCLLLDLREALPLVPLLQRKALVLHLMLHRTEEEAARHLCVARSVLRKRVHGGLLNLQKILNGRRFPLHTREMLSPLPCGEPGRDAA